MLQSRPRYSNIRSWHGARYSISIHRQHLTWETQVTHRCTTSHCLHLFHLHTSLASSLLPHFSSIPLNTDVSTLLLIQLPHVLWCVPMQHSKFLPNERLLRNTQHLFYLSQMNSNFGIYISMMIFPKMHWQVGISSLLSYCTGSSLLTVEK